MSETVVVTSDLGCELAYSALLRYLMNGVQYYNVSVDELGQEKSLDKYVTNTTKRLVCIGNFWQDEYLNELVNEHNELKLFNIRFPHNFNNILSILDPSLVTPAVLFAIKQHEVLITMIQNICFGKMTQETQPLVTGISNVLTNLPVEERYYRLFTGELNLNGVLDLGNKILESQISMVKERVLKNSRSGTFKDATRYAVTEGHELTNLTHDELHKNYPECKVTIVTSLKYSNGFDDQVSHSLRSWDQNVDVQKLVGEFGRGTNLASGARYSIDAHIDY
jgi:hypothetical protein